MKECTPCINEIRSSSDKEEVFPDPERFKSRMTRWMKSVDELWDEYEQLKKHSLRQVLGPKS